MSPRRVLVLAIALSIGLALFVSFGAAGRPTSTVRDLVDQNDGTVLDPNTGLTWLLDADLANSLGYPQGVSSRQAALQLIKAMNSGWIANYGFADWRLPTAREIDQLTSLHGLEPNAPGPFVNVRPAYWTELGLGSQEVSFALANLPDRQGFRRAAKRGSMDDSPTVWPVRAGVIGSEFRRLSIFASNSVWLQKGAQLLSGNALVNEASPGPTLNSEVEFSVARDVLTHPSPSDQGMLKADSFAIGGGSVIGSDSQDTIAYNDLFNQGTILATQIPTLSLPVIPLSSLPPFQSAVPGASDVVVPKNGMVAIAPGGYRDILIANGGIVLFQTATTLGPAVFDVRSISGGNDVQLRFESRTEVRAADKFNLGKTSFVGPDTSAISAGDIIFHVAGVNGSTGALSAAPESVRIGQSSTIRANFYAPNGTIFMQSSVDATGGFFARDVRVGVGARVNYDNFFGNEAPTANDQSVSTLEDNSLLVALTANDPDGDTLTFSINTGPSNGSLSGLTQVPPDMATVTYTPSPDFCGSDSFTFDADDGNGGVSTGTVTIDVVCVNDAPSFLKGPDISVLEDSGVQVNPGWATAISPGPANEASQTWTFMVTGNTNPGLFASGPAVSPIGTLTFTLAADANGVAIITLVLMDNGGTANGGVDTSPSQDFQISVTAVNDAPSFTGGPNQQVNQDSGPQSVPNWATGISAGPPDEAGQGLTFVVTGNTNTGLFSAGPAVSSAGTLTYTPAAGAFGTATITLVLMDDGGTANGGVDTSPSYMFEIRVNALPLVAADTYSALGNTPLQVGTSGEPVAISPLTAGNLLSNDSDPDSFPSALTVTTTGAIATTGGGVAVVDSFGNFTYTPAAGFRGPDAFMYTASDGAASVNGMVTINIVNMIWYIDGDAAAGDGRAGTPFNTIGAFNAVQGAASGAVAGDTVFLYNAASAYTQGATLLNSQRFLGEGVGLTVAHPDDAMMNVGLVAAGTRPLVTNGAGNGVTLASGNTVRGMNFGDRSGFALLGTSVGTLTVNNVDVIDSGAPGGSGGGASLSNGTLAVTLDSLNSSSSSSSGLFLTNSSGSFTVSGLTLVSSPGANAIDLQNLTGSTTFSGGVNIAASGFKGFFANSGGAIGIPGGTISTTNGIAFDAAGSTLSVVLNSVSANNGGQDGVHLQTNSGSVSLSGVSLTTTSGAGLNVNSSGTLNVTGSTNTVATSTGTAVRILDTTIGSGNVTFRSVNSTGVGINSGIALRNTGSGQFSVTGDGSTAGSGGTISNKSVDAITLQNTGGRTSLRFMVIQDITAANDGVAAIGTRSGVDGIHGQAVGGGLVVDNTTIRRISDNAINGGLFSDGISPTTWNGLQITNSHLEFSNRFATNPNVGDDADEAVVRINGITGTVLVTNSTFNNGAGALDLITPSGVGTLDMTVQGNAFTDLYKEFGCIGVVPTINVGRRALSVVVEGSHNAVVRVGDPAESNPALGNTFTNGFTASVVVAGQEGGPTPHTGNIDTVISENIFRVTDHLTGPAGCGGGSLAFNFPNGGVSLNPTGGTFEAIVSNNLFDQVFHAAGGLGQLTLGINTGGGASEFIVTGNEFRLPWEAAVQIRSENGVGGSSAVLFDSNTYVDGMVGGPSDDVGFSTPSPFQGMLVNVRNDSHLDLTVQNEDLPVHDVANSPTPQTMQVEVQNQAGNVLNLFVRDSSAPYGYGFTQSNGAFNLYRLNPGNATATTIMTGNGNTGGGGNPNLSPPTVVTSGTITPTDTAPTLPIITIP